MKKYLLSLSLRTHLLLITFLLAAPAAILIFFSGYEQRKDSINDGVQEARKLVNSIASEQFNLSDDTEQLLLVLAQLPEVKEHNAASASRILAGIHEKNPRFGNIVLTERNGTVWASALPMKESFSIGNKRSFLNTVASKRFSSGEYNIGKISAKATIGFGYPILNENGRIDGVISANLNFDHFKKNIKDAGLPEGSYYKIIDRNGIIIDTNIDADNYKGTRVADEIFLRMKKDPGEEVVITDSLGSKDRQITAYRKLRLGGERTPYLYIQGAIPLAGILAHAIEVQVYQSAILSLFLLVAVLLAIFVGNKTFVERIRKLQEASQSLAEGNLHVRVARDLGGGELGALGQAFDSMAEKLDQRESALVTSRLELNDLYNNAPCGYHSLNPEGMFIRINNTELNWLGYTREEVVGKMFLADILTPDGRATLQESFPQLKKKGSINDLEFDLRRKDGSYLRVLVNASGLFDQYGTFVMSRSTAYDITDRVKAEKLIQELNQNLTKRVEEETEKRLQQERLLARNARLAAMGEMIGAIAHQWRQPLTSIWATIQTIRMAWERQRVDDAFLRNAEADTKKQITYMSDTIEDFRNFFSPDKIYERFDIRDKIQDVAQLVSVQFANSGVAIQIVDNSPDTPLYVSGYQNEFKQSVLNLVSNAFDAVVEAEANNNGPANDSERIGVVTIAVTGEQDAVIIEVRDTGCGIPPEYADKIFEPYFTSKSEGKGTGIGLYMSKLIIEESLGGRLSFESGPDGTVFRIALTRDNSVEVVANE